MLVLDTTGCQGNKCEQFLFLNTMWVFTVLNFSSYWHVWKIQNGHTCVVHTSTECILRIASQQLISHHFFYFSDLWGKLASSSTTGASAVPTIVDKQCCQKYSFRYIVCQARLKTLPFVFKYSCGYQAVKMCLHFRLRIMTWWERQLFVFTVFEQEPNHSRLISSCSFSAF